MDDVFKTLDRLEEALRDQAARLKHTAQGMRDAAAQHDGHAFGLLAAADRLREIERPQ